MNHSRPVASPGQPLILVLEHVPYAYLLGGHLTPRLTLQQRAVIEGEMHQAGRDGVPLVIVLWPATAPQISDLVDLQVQPS